MSAEAGTAGRPLLMGMAGTVPDPYSHQNPVEDYTQQWLYEAILALKNGAPPYTSLFLRSNNPSLQSESGVFLHSKSSNCHLPNNYVDILFWVSTHLCMYK